MLMSVASVRVMAIITNAVQSLRSPILSVGRSAPLLSDGGEGGDGSGGGERVRVVVVRG